MKPSAWVFPIRQTKLVSLVGVLFIEVVLGFNYILAFTGTELASVKNIILKQIYKITKAMVQSRE